MQPNAVQPNAGIERSIQAEWFNEWSGNALLQVGDTAHLTKPEVSDNGKPSLLEV
jgi:hypothetical protein